MKDTKTQRTSNKETNKKYITIFTQNQILLI